MAVQAGLGQPGRRRQLPARNITAADVACTAPHGAALRLGPQLQGGRAQTSISKASISRCKPGLMQLLIPMHSLFAAD